MRNLFSRNTNTNVNSSHKKRKILIIISIIAIVFFFIIPIVINELYKSNVGYLTMWEAADVLSYYAEILGGLISISALIATIYYSKKDTEKQIRVSMSQLNVPFFIIENVYVSNEENTFNKADDDSSWEIKYPYRLNHPECCFIILKNIGDGVAISPRYSDGFHFEDNDDIPCFITSGANLKIKYVFADTIFSNVLAHSSNIILKYQNTVGINFNQQITVQHRLNAINNSVNVVIKKISVQHIDFEC